MGIIKVIKDNRRQFLITDIEIYGRSDISWEAKALHTYLMSKPENWDTRISELISAGPAKKDKIQKMFKELKRAGYMSRVQFNDPESGQFVTVTNVFERVDLNPEETPIYGGTKNNDRTVTRKPDHGIDTVTENPVTDRGGSNRDGKPGHIVNIDLNKDIYKGDPKNFNWLENDDIGHQGPVKESVNSMVTILTSICKGFANVLVPDNCEFHQTAITLLENDIDEDDVFLFGAWWNENGHYPGKPAIKSLRDNIENYKDGLVHDLFTDMAVWNSVLDWTARRIKTEDLDGDVKRTIGKVGESYLRTLNSSNERNIKAKVLSTYKEIVNE